MTAGQKHRSPNEPAAQSRDNGDRTLIEEPRKSFVSFLDRLLGPDRLSFLNRKSAAAAVSEPTESNEPPPSHIDRFEIISELGRGGFGIVYLAHDPILDRKVAIKKPHPWLVDDPVAAARSLKEAQLASKLRHPGIVTIHDIREREGRIEFVVQEYIEGTTLHQLMSKRTLSIRTSVELLLKMSEAIQAAHAIGVYHRDLKPANVIVDQRGGAHILDFGLAIDEETQIQLRGQVAGTAAYMSPEQILGDAHHLDGRTDIWALGVIFYELLTGRKPFRGNSQEIAAQVIERAPAPPRQFLASIPKRVESCCLKCLEKPLEQRYASVADLIEELQRVLDELPIAENGSLLLEVNDDQTAAQDTKRLLRDQTKRLPGSTTRPLRRSAWLSGIALGVLSLGAIASALYGFGLLKGREREHLNSIGVINALAREPSRLFVMDLDHYSDAYIDEQLYVHCRGACTYLLEGPINSNDYQVHMQIRQLPEWQGKMAVGYGVRPSKENAGTYIGYYLELRRVHPQKNDWMLLYQLLASSPDQQTIERQYNLHQIPLREPPVGGDQNLVLWVRKGRLTKVEFGGQSYPVNEKDVSRDAKNEAHFLAHYGYDTNDASGMLGFRAIWTSAVLKKAQIVPSR